MDLSLQHLRILVAVADHGGITSAAQALSQSQPALTATVRRLERHIGGQLFVRTRRGTQPTPLGRRVIVEARALLAHFEQLSLLRRARPHNHAAVPRVGGQRCVATTELAARLPQVLGEVIFRVDHSVHALLHRLATGSLDVCLVLEPVGHELPVPDGVRSEILLEREPALIGLSPKHPLADEPAVDLARLAEFAWLDDPDDDSGWPTAFRSACQAAGFTPKVRYWGADPLLASRLVGSGRAVGLFFPSFTSRTDIALRPIVGNPIANRYLLLSRPHAEPIAARIGQELTDSYQRLVLSRPDLASLITVR